MGHLVYSGRNTPELIVGKYKKHYNIIMQDRFYTWYYRLWLVISNPFRYIFKGKLIL